MGIVNVTPDSFSDGGSWFDPHQAIEHGRDLVAQGAALLDIGGESTRPFSEPVSAAEQVRRVLPVIKALKEQVPVPLSIDTSSAEVAAAALAAGAEIINDVSGFTADPHLISVALESGAGVCAMHMQGTPQTMQLQPHYEDCVGEIADYLNRRLEALLEAGIPREKICLDPGVGFGKTHTHNWELIQQADKFLQCGVPVLVGHSRKGFIAKSTGDSLPERDAGTLGISLHLAERGIQVIRLHEIRATANAWKTFYRARGGR